MMSGTSIYSLDIDVLKKCNLRKLKFHKITTSDTYTLVSKQHKQLKKINKNIKIKLPMSIVSY